MKVITKVVICIKDQLVIQSENYNYDGPVAECKGGGATTSTTTTTGEIDYAYNDRMATIAEQQQDIANEYAEFWRTEYKPLESAQIGANLSLINTQTQTERARQETERLGLDLQQEQIEAERGLIPQQTQLAQEQIGLGVAQAQQGQREIREAAPVFSEFYKQALQGQDPDRAVSRARGDVAAGFRGAEGAERRALGRVGITGLRRTEGQIRQRFQEQARATAFASTQAREGAEERNFQRLSGAVSQFKGGLGGRG
jgi:hypothetical protein